MMCDTSLMHTANGLRAAAHSPAEDRFRRPVTPLTCANQETAKVIGKP